MKRVAIFVALVAVLAGAGAGIALALRGGSGLSPAEARAQVARLERQWHAHLRADADRHFPSPSAGWLSRHLRIAAGLCGCFTVVKVHVFRAAQPAPRVVVEGKDERGLLAVNGLIFDLIDHDPVSEGDKNWAYKGFFLEALDTAGVPFFATALWPDNNAAGGQAGGTWATPSLARNFAHG